MAETERVWGRSSLSALALVALLFLAGCAGPSDGDETPSPSLTGTDTVTVGEPRTADGDNAPRTPTATPAPDRPSPWGDDPITVGIAGDGNGREYTSIVRTATDYWAENAEYYAGYPVSFRVRPNASTPDVVVRFVSNVPDCGGTEEAVGCAPYITDRAQIDRPVPVYVRTGLAADPTVRVLKHEFGHIFGLNHDDAPHPLMRSVLYITPQPNATEQAFAERFDVHRPREREQGRPPAKVRLQIDN